MGDTASENVKGEAQADGHGTAGAPALRYASSISPISRSATSSSHAR